MISEYLRLHHAFFNIALYGIPILWKSADPSFAVRGSAPRKLLHKILVERLACAPAAHKNVFSGLCFACLGHESCCWSRLSEAFYGRAFCLARARLLLAFGCFGPGPKHCFFTGSKGNVWSILSACFLLGMCSNPAGVRVFRNRTKALFFMGSKGNVKHSFGMLFAWHGLESCWRSGVSEPDQSIVSYGFQR